MLTTLAPLDIGSGTPSRTALEHFDTNLWPFLHPHTGIDISIAIGICVTIDHEVNIIVFSNHLCLTSIHLSILYSYHLTHSNV